MTSLFHVGQTGNRGIASFFDDRKEVRRGNCEGFVWETLCFWGRWDSHVRCMADTWKWDSSVFVRAQVFGVASAEPKDVYGGMDPGRRSRVESERLSGGKNLAEETGASREVFCQMWMWVELMSGLPFSSIMLIF